MNKLDIDDIIKAVSLHQGISCDDIKRVDHKKKDVTRARKYVAWLCYHFTSIPLEYIGIITRGKTHVTVYHRALSICKSKDKRTWDDLEEIKSSLKGKRFELKIFRELTCVD